MVPKDVKDHIFFLKNGWTKELDKVIKKEKTKRMSRKLTEIIKD